MRGRQKHIKSRRKKFVSLSTSGVCRGRPAEPRFNLGPAKDPGASAWLPESAERVGERGGEKEKGGDQEKI